MTIDKGHFKYLDNLDSPQYIKKLSFNELNMLSDELREFIIDSVSRTGGHLASNLGVVELSIALHRVFETPKDKIIWDVGHQSYVHKIITGRKDQFNTLKQFGGISGFPRIKESPHDVFDTGHSSTSISAALGFARARDIKNENYSVVAVIGDGALTGGMSFEALNDAGRSTTNLIVILNDNEMSISRNVGGMSRHLSNIRSGPYYYKFKEDMEYFFNRVPVVGKKTKNILHKIKSAIKYNFLPGILFEEIGFKYLGPIDGHNIEEMTSVLTKAKNLKGPVFLHVCTQKGKGYSFAEEKPQVFHGISPFEVETGEVLSKGGKTYSDIFGETILELAEKNDKIVAITAAMPNATGLEAFSKKYPTRFFDVGIAEQHAVTMSAGLAANGLTPVFAVYSSFLQRAFDQVHHDAAIGDHHVVIGVDRAGIVGDDGETHQGIYDLSYLRHIPNMVILAASDYTDLKNMLTFAVENYNGPIAVRYPRGRGLPCISEANEEKIVLGKSVCLQKGEDLTILAVGSMVNTALEAAKILKLEKNIDAEVINARFVKPLDEEAILQYAKKTGKLVTIEDNTVVGGFGSAVSELLHKSGLDTKLLMLGFEDKFIEHGSIAKLMFKYGLTPEAVAEKTRRYFFG